MLCRYHTHVFKHTYFLTYMHVYICVRILFITNIGSWIQVAVIKHFGFSGEKFSCFLTPSTLPQI